MAKKILSVFLVFTLLLCGAGCNPYYDTNEMHRLVYTDDFVFQVREEDERAILIDITEEGGQKEVLKVPAFVEGYPVYKIGMKTAFFSNSQLQGENVKKIYLPYTTGYINIDAFIDLKLDELVMVYNYGKKTSGPSKEPMPPINTNYLFDTACRGVKKYIFTPKHYEILEKVPPYYSAYGDYVMPNYTFYFNYEDSPNEGTYWID